MKVEMNIWNLKIFKQNICELHCNKKKKVGQT